MIFFGNYVPSFITDLDILLASREPYNKHRKVRVVLKDEKTVSKEEPRIPKEIHEAVKKATEAEIERLNEEAKQYKIVIDWDTPGRTTLSIFRSGEEIKRYSAPLPSHDEFDGLVNEAIKALDAVNPRKGM